VSGPTPGKEGNVNVNTSPEFRWLERGEGEPVVLLHGLMGAMDHWEAVLEGLGRSCRAMAPLLPIFDPLLAEPSIGELADHVVRLLDRLGVERAVVGGNSLGGHVALTLALRWPGRVSGLVLTGSSGLFERGFTRNVPHVPTAEYVRTKMEEIFYDPSLVTPSWVEAVRRTVTTRATALRVLQLARAAKRDSLEARLPEIAVPTLLVWGKDDRITPVEVAERFHALIPDSELVYITNCGHAPMLEHPGAFAQVVEEWRRETASRRAPAGTHGTSR
jgi:pimeloyl-ACP methyl ester carboxylesterase